MKTNLIDQTKSYVAEHAGREAEHYPGDLLSAVASTASAYWGWDQGKRVGNALISIAQPSPSRPDHKPRAFFDVAIVLVEYGAAFSLGKPSADLLAGKIVDDLWQIPLSNEHEPLFDEACEVTDPESQEFLDAINENFGTEFKMKDF